VLLGLKAEVSCVFVMKLQICYTKKCERHLKPISDALYEFYGLRTFANKALDIQGTAYNAERKQYDAAALLEYLTRVKDADIALWVVDQDIYCKDMGYIFGYALLRHGAVLSTSRLNSTELVQKEAVHEVGHVLGLKHCSNRCLMQFSNSLEEAKAKPMKLCEKCVSSVKIPDLINIR